MAVGTIDCGHRLPRPTCLPVGSVDWSLAKKVDQLLFILLVTAAAIILANVTPNLVVSDGLQHQDEAQAIFFVDGDRVLYRRKPPGICDDGTPASSTVWQA